MRKKCSILLIITGTVLIISALFLCIYNIMHDKKSGEKAQEILSELKSNIEITQPSAEEYYNEILNQSDIFAQPTTEAKEVTQTVINGNSYAGYISMPTLGLELPVMSDWSYSYLDYSPCRYSGNAADNNLIIAAHNYSSHFRKIGSLNSGDTIYFTDAGGNVYEYQVSYTELIDGSDAASMLSDTDNSWDLTLFTCTIDGQKRVTVRAVKVNAE